MIRARFASFAGGALLVLLAGTAGGEDAKTPRTDLYGDPLPPEAVMRLGTIRLRHLRHRGGAVAFSRDGKHLISCGNYEVRVWDAATRRLVRRTRLAWKASEGDWHAEVSLTPDGTTAVAWGRDGLAKCLYDTATGQERGRLSRASVLAFSPDSKKMAVRWWDKEGTGSLQLWDIVGFKKHQSLDVPPGTVLSGTAYTTSKAAFTPDGKQLAALDGGGQELLVWDTVTGKLKQRKKFPTSMSSLAYAPDGATLAVGHRSNSGRAEVVLFDAAALKEKAAQPAQANVQVDGYVDLLGFSSDGRLLAGSYIDMVVPGRPRPQEHCFLIWDLNKPAEPRRLLSGSQISAFAFAPDGKTLAYRDSNRDVIEMLDVASGRPFRQPPGHDTPVGTLAVSPDGKVLASGDYKPTLFLWDTVTGKPLRSLTGREEYASTCLFSADGQRMISVSGRGKFQVWEVATGKERRYFAIDPPPGNDFFRYTVETVALSSDGKRLAAVASARTPLTCGPDIFPMLFTWDAATGKQLNRRSLAMRTWKQMSYRWRAVLAPDGESVAEWRGDRLVIEDISTKSLLAILPKDVGDPRVFSADGRLLAAVTFQPRKESSPQYDVKGLSLIETASGQEIVRLEIGPFDYVAFAPDSRAVVTADTQKLSVWDAATGERLHQMEWPESVRDWRGEANISSLAVLPGGSAATGMTEGDILVWDLAPSTWPVRQPARQLSRDQFDALWSDLAGDAGKAHRALDRLTAARDQAMPFLKDCLRPATLDAKRVEKLLADLDSDVFETRETASRELARMRYRAEPMLRRALEGNPSLETRRRLQTILAEPNRPSREDLRRLRTLVVLERIGTPEARHILEKLGGGAAARETREAQAALQRLKRR
ncbi:MAG TPA: WD40 repeat domain-containing protein [Gemmataceae bacterium]|jgi:WD40 repeat protein